MTYGVERMTFQGKTLHEKLRAQYGDRTAKSVSRGLEANAKKKAKAASRGETSGRSPGKRREHPDAAGRRTVTSVMRTVDAKSHSGAGRRKANRPAQANGHPVSAQRGATGDVRRRPGVGVQTAPHAGRTFEAPRANRVADATRVSRTFEAPRANRAAEPQRANFAPRMDRRYEAPVQSVVADGRGTYEDRNPYRMRVNYFKKPVTGKSDLEVSIATFPRAYRAGMRAQRIMGNRVVNDRSAEHAEVRRGYRSGDVKSDRSAYENSVGTMAQAYRRGERMRRVTQIANAKPTPKSEEETKALGRFIARARTLILGKGSHTAELRLKHTPFPLGTLAIMAVCTLVVMVMISSFAQLSEYRAQISDLENRQDKLALDRTRLTGLVESREDIRVIEKIATQDIGMVSAELAKGRFVSLADCDRVEVIEDEPKEESGMFATILSAISENLGALSEYIN